VAELPHYLSASSLLSPPLLCQANRSEKQRLWKRAYERVCDTFAGAVQAMKMVMFTPVWGVFFWQAEA